MLTLIKIDDMKYNLLPPLYIHVKQNLLNEINLDIRKVESGESLLVVHVS